MKSSVRYDPNDPNVILASTLDDGQVTAQSGLWRSTDGGLTWNRAAVSYPCTTRPNTFEIAVVPGNDVHQKMFVANDCGVAYTNDSGATWSNVDPRGVGGTQFGSVAAVRTGSRHGARRTRAQARRSTRRRVAAAARRLRGRSLRRGPGNRAAISRSHRSTAKSCLLSSVARGRQPRRSGGSSSPTTARRRSRPLFPLTDSRSLSGNGRPAPVDHAPVE